MIIIDENLREECYKLRHEVYCVEKGWETGTDGMEYDEYDTHSLHALIKKDDIYVGTTRIVLPPLPIEKIFNVPSSIQVEKCVEPSRFCIKKEYRGQDLIEELMKALVLLTKRTEAEYWLCTMEPSLLRRLEKIGFHFMVLGNHIGPRYPCLRFLTTEE